MATHYYPEDIIGREFTQRAAEGDRCDDLRALWQQACEQHPPAPLGVGNPDLRPTAQALLHELNRRAILPSEGEPEELDAIFRLAADEPTLPTTPRPGAIRGAWLGRAAGCLLGKPVEKINREGIRAILASQHRLPLDAYFTGEGVDEAVLERWPWNPTHVESLAENITGMAEDDDLNHPMLTLDLLEQRGTDWDTADLGELWLTRFPAGKVATAERIAYLNLLAAVDIDAVATTSNPYREWIGALIRTDVYGWVNPGQPRTAAALAYRDARLSHRRNGVYGAMWVAAVCSAAVVTDDVEQIFAAGASVIPAGSGFAQAVAFGREVARTETDREQALDLIHERYAGWHWVHAITNGCSIAWAIQAAADRGWDYTDGITGVVTCGWDTDSAGATVGSVIGAVLGSESLPPQWIAPLRDSVRSTLVAGGQTSLSGLADRTERLAETMEGVA